MRLLRGLAKGIFVLFIFSVIMGNLIDFQLKKGKENSSVAFANGSGYLQGSTGKT